MEKPKNLVERPVFKAQYDNFIGGRWVKPVKGEYFENVSPIDGKAFTSAARSTAEDIELALDAAHTAFPTWSKSAAAYRSNLLLKIADIMEQVAGVYPKVMIDGDMEAGAWSCGMVAGLIHDIPSCQELIGRIMSEADALINKRLVGMSRG